MRYISGDRLLFRLFREQSLTEMNDSGKPVIGLVGGVGAGKSTAAREFEALGCLWIDADHIGHEILDEPGVREEIRSHWGEDVFGTDGAVDRQALAEIVFGDPGELAALNGISWPRIAKRVAEAIAQAMADPNRPGIVLDAPELFEAKWDAMCSHVLFVSAGQADRKLRAGLKGLSEQDWRRRENSQISLDIKERGCYGKLDNSSNVSHLREQVRRTFYQIASRTDSSQK